MANGYTGNTYKLTNCLAERNGKDIKITGDYEVLEYHVTEPSAYIWSPGFTLVPANCGTEPEEWEPNVVWVDADELLVHVDPEALAWQMYHERCWEEEAAKWEEVGNE